MRATKRQSDEATKGQSPSFPSVASSLRRSVAFSRRSGFTFTEILIVIGIIVLMLAIAVPAFNFIRGSRSVDAAENQLSALCGRARTRAIGLQEFTGVFFFKDLDSGRYAATLVRQTPAQAGDSTDVDVYLDLAPDQDFLLLPPSVSAQVVDDCVTTTAGVRTDDGYIGFNKSNANPAGMTSTSVPYGGVILFDASGRLVSRFYAFRIAMFNGATPPVLQYTEMGKLLFDHPNATNATPVVESDVIPFVTATLALKYLRLHSQFGVVLFDHDEFQNGGGNDDDSQISGNPYPAPNGTEQAEETWLDDNSTPLLINRYNGTLIKGE